MLRSESLESRDLPSTVAVIVAFHNPNLKADLEFFSDFNNLPTPKLSIYTPQGRPRVAPADWAGEATTDVECIHLFAPDVDIALVEARNDSYNALLKAANWAAINLDAEVVSMSWGGEPPKNINKLAKYLDVPTTTFVAAAGDEGPDNPNFPASLPNVISVAGPWSYSGPGDVIQSTDSVLIYDTFTEPKSPWWITAGTSVSTACYAAELATSINLI